MGIDLHELIRRPGTRVPFQKTLSLERLTLPAVTGYPAPPAGEGYIINNAGALTLRGHIRGRLQCVCDRCTALFEKEVDIPLEQPLATELQDEEDPDYFLLDGEVLDIDDLLESAYILNMDTVFLCRDDCKGLCPRCGANLNNGPCGCGKDRDPRLAVLGQLLDDTDQRN